MVGRFRAAACHRMLTAAAPEPAEARAAADCIIVKADRRFVDAFDNRDVVVCGTEIAIGATYRDAVLASLLG